MARVFITGSADGLGRAAAQKLLDDGHEVVVHARNNDRLTAVRDLVDRGAAAVVGDLSDAEQTRAIAEQIKKLGRMDAVIHNAGVYSGQNVMPVNIVAPYLLTALIDRPQRLVYLSSSEHRGGRAKLTEVDWTGRTAGPLPGQQALRHHARRCRRPSVARRPQQRGRPGLGAHTHGWPRRA
jgi:NAD(P)-dependent dehydrogenase (short-subunit alcohol dehydrogenase family)